MIARELPQPTHSHSTPKTYSFHHESHSPKEMRHLLSNNMRKYIENKNKIKGGKKFFRFSDSFIFFRPLNLYLFLIFPQTVDGVPLSAMFK